jgi:hypothetical protein
MRPLISVFFRSVLPARFVVENAFDVRRSAHHRPRPLAMPRDQKLELRRLATTKDASAERLLIPDTPSNRRAPVPGINAPDRATEKARSGEATKNPA